ncbi:MAG: MBL fold metallo-hydrolase [Eubacteriales bacterium]
MKVANGVDMLELSANLFTGPSIIHPALVYDKDEVILVDAGFPGQLSIIREAVEKAGLHFDKLSKIIITHHDIDHIGSLSDILKESPQRVEVLAHEGEKPYIQGEQPPIKMTPERMAQLEAQLNSLPEERRQAIKAVFGNYKERKTFCRQTPIQYPGAVPRSQGPRRPAGSAN